MMHTIFLSEKHSRYISLLDLAMHWLRNFHKLGNQSFRGLIEKGFIYDLIRCYCGKGAGLVLFVALTNGMMRKMKGEIKKKT